MADRASTDPWSGPGVAGDHPAGDIRLRVPSLLARRVGVLAGTATLAFVFTLPDQTVTMTYSDYTA